VALPSIWDQAAKALPAASTAAWGISSVAAQVADHGRGQPTAHEREPGGPDVVLGAVGLLPGARASPVEFMAMDGKEESPPLSPTVTALSQPIPVD